MDNLVHSHQVPTTIKHVCMCIIVMVPPPAKVVFFKVNNNRGSVTNSMVMLSVWAVLWKIALQPLKMCSTMFTFTVIYT